MARRAEQSLSESGLCPSSVLLQTMIQSSQAVFISQGSNSSAAIPNINTTRILEKKANWRPKYDLTHSLIPLCTYRYVFMPHGMQGSEEPNFQGKLSKPSPDVRKLERGWAGYARLIITLVTSCTSRTIDSPPLHDVKSGHQSGTAFFTTFSYYQSPGYALFFKYGY